MTIHKVPMVKSNVKKKMYGIEGLVIEEMVTKADHEVVLKAKELEITDLRDKYEGAKLQKDSTAHAYKELEEKYNDLMQQAVRFAEWYDFAGSDTMKRNEVYAFLARPDVQARRTEEG